MTENNNGNNNGHKNNGHSNNVNGIKRNKVTFVTFKIRADIVDEFRERSIKAGVDYSTYIKMLFEMEDYQKAFKDPRLREALEQTTKLVLRSLTEQKTRETGGFNY